MIGNYARLRISEQLKALAFIVLYLVAFQILVFDTTPSNALRVAAGIGMVVFGLTFFLEGLIIGLMPLGERVGLKLPQRAGLAAIMVFGLLLGFGSTLAEPAVAALRVMGGGVKAWEAPLLYSILENDPEKLVLSIGAGVGVAVAVGMIRLYFGLSIKPFIYTVVPLLLAVSFFCGMDENLAALLGLAWDTGAVTTGPVTVPLVMALGIGVSRSIGRSDGGSGGFGIIMLASAFPVLGVLVLGIALNSGVPRIMSEADFFAPAQRSQAMRIFPSEEALLRHAWQRGGPAARKAFYADAGAYLDAVRSLADDHVRRFLLAETPLNEWLRVHASEKERALLSGEFVRGAEPRGPETQPLRDVLRSESAGALRSVVPLTALLLVSLIFFLRDRLPHNDEFTLGICMCVIGMALLTGGIRVGLVPLGDEVGRSLPRLSRAIRDAEESIVFDDFDFSHLFYVYGEDGATEPYFYFQDPEDGLRRESFNAGRYDDETGRYEHTFIRDRRLSRLGPLFGAGLVLVFAFGMGYGSTLAEPALNALGRKVEEISVGTVKRQGVMHAVSLGVGLGLVAGVLRVFHDIPMIWMIFPPYLLLLWLARRSEEDFAGIACDCGGVTTGPVTVPLVMAMGLGIGGKLHVVEGFGALAMASVYPIITVMFYGLIVRARQRRSIRAAEDADDG